MLTLTMVEEIDRLLKEGQLSQRKIAARLGVSRGTVSAIASGRRGLHGKDPSDGVARLGVSGAPAERCPRCGHRIYLPCLICLARQYRQSQKFLRTAGGFGGPRRVARAQGRKSATRVSRRIRRQRPRPARSRVA